MINALIRCACIHTEIQVICTIAERKLLITLEMKISLQISQTPVRNMLNTPRSSNVSHINTSRISGIYTPSTSGVGSSGPCTSESSTPNARSRNTSSNDIHSLGHRDLLIRIYERQEEILQRLKAQAAHDKICSAKSKENLVVPIGVKNDVKQGYKDGEEKGLSWSFEGKRKQKEQHNISVVKKAKITEALKPIYMSSDEEGQEGFITNPHGGRLSLKITSQNWTGHV
ncbi:unnamed protein product [Mytilus coruscus]|uniref:Uncharacterized protein n=1 Tax=Mytilus coruscus TaxID=42192 RepID=A0A6J8AGK1_MYTCO|nr:unnamed protein product [Mytilus coruscus]